MKSLSAPKSLEVEIEISDPVPTDAETEADFQALMDVKKVSARDIKKLRALGLHVKRQGILETQRGALFVTQAWLLGITNEIGRLMVAKNQGEAKDVPTNEMCELGELFAKLVGKGVELSAVMTAQEPKEANGHEPPAAPNASFPPGAVVVGGNATAHFHQTPPPEKTVAKPPDGA